MRLDPNKVTKNVWFNDRMNQWNWILIYGDHPDLQMHSGNAVDKQQAKRDIMRTMQWMEENL